MADESKSAASGNASSEGYRQDVSRSLSIKFGENDNDSISSKEEGYQRDDSRDLEDMAEEDGISSKHKTEDRPAIARKRVKQRVNPSEEETQIIPLSLGDYIDHSLDPIIDDPPFAPLQRMANFPETLFAILCNERLSSIITWMPHGRSFTILDRNEFVRNVLPSYYRTSRVGSFSKQLNGYGFTKIKLDVSHYSYYHMFFLRGLPHLVKNIKRNGSVKSGKGRSMTEADLERISAEAPVPDRVSATSNANAAIDRINQQYEVNLLQEASSEELQRVQAPPSASFPISPPQITSSNVASQLGGPTLPPANYEPILPVSASPQFQSVAPPLNLPLLSGAYNLPHLGSGLPAAQTPAPGWDMVTSALLRAFQTAQAQRQLQEQVNQAHLALLANALLADLQNAQNRVPLPYPPPLTPSQLGVLNRPAPTVNSFPNIPSTIYTPRWQPTMLQHPQPLGPPVIQRQPLHENSNLNDSLNFYRNTEPDDGNDSEENNVE